VHDGADGRLEDVGHRGAVRRCRRAAQVLSRRVRHRARTNVGAGGNYYHNSLKALRRMNRLMTRLALARPRRIAK